MSVTLWAAVCIAPAAQAGEIWTWTHEGAGQGTANVFDGGPVVSNSDMSSAPQGFGFSAFDRTASPGSHAADFGTSGSSRFYTPDDMLEYRFRFHTNYSGGLTSQDDHPGGQGGGSLRAVAEIVMPVDNVDWLLSYHVTRRGNFSGNAHLRIENVTQQTTVLEFFPSPPFSLVFFDRPFEANVGDVIRISAEADGSGFVPPGVNITFPGYEVSLGMVFAIPEPGTLYLFGAGLAVFGRRRRRRTLMRRRT